MARITIEVPDEFVQHLEPFQNRLSELFTSCMTSVLLSEVPEPSTLLDANAAATGATYQEVIDFLISRPTFQEILSFKVSDQAQHRLQDLLTRNRDTGLSLEEKSELDLYEQLDALMSLLKAKAFISLRSATES